LGKEMLTGEPGLSTGREREGGESGWAWPKKKKGARGGTRPKG